VPDALRPDRHPDLLDADDTLLLLIDFQGKLFRMVQEPARVVARTAIVLQAAERLGLPLLLTEHYPRGLGATDPEVRALLPRYEPLTKTVFSCCGAPDFVAAVAAAQRRQVLVAGIETHICVSQTVHDLLARGYDVHVAADCVSARGAADHRVALERMARAGALLTTAEAAAYELFYRADTPVFKEFVAWLKERA